MATSQAATKQQVKVTVDYLPATEDLHEEFVRTDEVEAVRTAAKTFFGVQDRQERDTYFYYLVHSGQRIHDTSVTLEQLIGEHARAAHFSLVEEVTQGER